MVAVQARLHQSLGEATLGQVVCRGEQPLLRRSGHHRGQSLLGGKVRHRRHSAEMAVVQDVLPHRATQLACGLTEHEHCIARVPESRTNTSVHVVDDAQHTHQRVGPDGLIASTVVQADVASGDRNLEFPAAVQQPQDRLGELPHDRRVQRGTEIEAVGDRHRAGATHGDVAVCLRERQLRPQVRVEQAVASVGVQ